MTSRDFRPLYEALENVIIDLQNNRDRRLIISDIRFILKLEKEMPNALKTTP